ncbi:MAG: uncharacterized protein JWM80_3632 [Cyanobacteria bacterium RYN_339]|nr:uncharacterized protein [Cyanobacteria bacterium RYN_339]
MKTLLALASAATLLLAGCGATPKPVAGAPVPTSYAVQAAKADNAFPGVGHIVQVNFGNKWDLHFTSMTQMTYTPAGHPITDGETVKIAVTPIRPGVFMVTWQESDGTTVVHVEDYENGQLWTNIGTADHKFLNLHGTLKIVK